MFEHRLSALVGWVGWLVGSVAALLAGDVLPGTGLLASRSPRSPSSDPKTVGGRASLVLSRTKGWPGQRQQDARSSFPACWRGAGAWIGGELQVDDRGLLWSPSAQWRGFGAKEFLIAWSKVEGVQLLHGRPEGTAIRLRPDGEVWFALHAASLRSAIESHRIAA